MRTPKSFRRSAIARWILPALGVLALGCGKKPPPEEPEVCDRQTVTAAIISTALINPAESGAARPVQLRLYQLKNDVNFRNLPFEQVWKEDEAKLGEDLLDRQEFPVYPDARKEVEFERNPEAMYVVAAGLFRTPKGKQWFTSFELPPNPGEEACGAKCPDGDCSQPPVNEAKIYIRVDGTRVVDGSDLADFVPEPKGVPNTATASVDTKNAGADSVKP